MNIFIDANAIWEFAGLPPHILVWRMFWLFGWLPTAIIFLWAAKEIWLNYIRMKWGAQQKYVLLAIDIPRGNQQSPKAVENIFAYLAGAHGTLNLIDIYWTGKFQLSFSFEIVSIEGYTQFLVRTPETFRDLVETAIYSQYPEAEITEVNDYTVGMPINYPDDTYDVWGAEFVQRRNSAYPIKTYKDFEHQMGEPELHYKDPMAALMDLCSSLKKGEQLWYQLIVIPTGWDWPEIGEREISKIVGEKFKGKENFFSMIGNVVFGALSIFTDMFSVAANGKKEDEPFRMLNLKPIQKRQVEAINEKVGKLGLEFKIRMVYLAQKEVMNKPKVANGFVGYIKQFAYNDLNNIKPDMKLTATSTDYFFKESRLNDRKRRIMVNYKKRDDWAGKNRGIFNVEELATIWHFPVESVVKAPLIQKAPGRKSVPPSSLPIGQEAVSEEFLEPIFEESKLKELQLEESGINNKKLDSLSAPSIDQATPKNETAQALDRGAPPPNLPFT